MSIPSSFFLAVLIRKQFAFAGETLLVYDYLITLSLEVEYIWNGPWTVVKALFLINRYGNLIGQTFIMLEETGYLSRASHEFCVVFEMFYPFYAVFAGESIRFLVVMRTCAILGCKRSVAAMWYTLYCLYAAGVVAGSIYVLSLGRSYSFEHLDEVRICIAPVPHDDWIAWFIPLLLDSIMFAIICYSLCQLSRGNPPSQLIRLLGRDAILFYLATLFNDIFSIVCWSVFGRDPRDFIQSLISYPVLTIVGQRLVLNLRRFRMRPDSTHDLSREVARQMAAMDILDHEQSDLGLELSQLVGEQQGTYDTDV